MEIEFKMLPSVVLELVDEYAFKARYERFLTEDASNIRVS